MAHYMFTTPLPVPNKRNEILHTFYDPILTLKICTNLYAS